MECCIIVFDSLKSCSGKIISLNLFGQRVVSVSKFFFRREAIEPGRKGEFMKIGQEYKEGIFS